ncbi:hypothetical protein DH2020_018260 [Rehmannia glutinosa]|uniref:Uncharacterized protein n=1 Tax=Rehmannia glutinosa TaxID=99300 RepID=A0ABR0WKE3_REHGL
MEVPGMDEVKKPENHMTSAAAFVEGGIQDPCADTCSICLEAFCDSDPSTVSKKLQLSMCWQPISLKDPDSQELLEAIERRDLLGSTHQEMRPYFTIPPLGILNCSMSLPVGVNDPELEDRIIQHLAAAAAMGRTHCIARTEGSRSRSSAHTRPHFLAPGVAETESAATTVTNPSLPLMSSSVQSNQTSASSSGSLVTPTTCQTIANDNRSCPSESSSPNLDRAGPSEFQSFSDTWKSRLSAMSMKEVNAGIATVSRMMERLETRDGNRAGRVPPANDIVGSSGLGNHDNRDTPN